MSIQLAVIATAGGRVISEAHLSSQLRSLVLKVLQKTPRHDNRMSYIYENYVFHYWVEHEVIYMLMADKDVATRIAFACLEECMRRFRIHINHDENKYPVADELSRDIGMKFDAILIDQIKFFNDPNTDKVSRVRRQIDEVKHVMLENIDSVLQRGDQIDVLVNKTTELNHQADGFRKNAKSLRRRMQWKNIRLILIVVFIIAILALVIALSICGITFSKCKNPSVPQAPPSLVPSPSS